MQLEDIRSILLLSSWYSSLPQHLAEQLLESSKLKTLSDQQILHKKNEHADAFHCVLTGRIRISNFTIEGKELVLTWMQPGNWFGEISLLDGKPRTHDAHAEGETVILKVAKSSFESLLKGNHEWHQHFTRLLCQRVRATFMLIDETGCLSLKGQLCKRLLLMHQGLEQQNKYTFSADLAISQDALAQLIHSSRQTVNKILQSLQEQQVIQLRYGRIVIQQPSKLKELSQI